MLKITYKKYEEEKHFNKKGVRERCRYFLVSFLSAYKKS